MKKFCKWKCRLHDPDKAASTDGNKKPIPPSNRTIKAATKTVTKGLLRAVCKKLFAVTHKTIKCEVWTHKGERCSTIKKGSKMKHLDMRKIQGKRTSTAHSQFIEIEKGTKCPCKNTIP